MKCIKWTYDAVNPCLLSFAANSIQKQNFQHFVVLTVFYSYWILFIAFTAEQTFGKKRDHSYYFYFEMSLLSLKFALNITLECLTLIFEQIERPN